MKSFILLITAALLSAGAYAQGNSGKTKAKDNPSSQNGNQGNNDKIKDKDKGNKVDITIKTREAEHDKKIWDGIGDNSCMKPSKNQPAKVRAAFQRDYPGVVNVRWTKCRGDWTATFNGLIFRSTAVYHANGDRRDTRTPVLRDNIPRRIIDIILKRFPGSPIDGAIKIEVPNVIKDIFRIKSVLNGETRYDYYDADGIQVTYNY